MKKCPKCGAEVKPGEDGKMPDTCPECGADMKAKAKKGKNRPLAEADGPSLDEIMRAVGKAVADYYKGKATPEEPYSYAYAEVVFTDTVVVRYQAKLYRHPWAKNLDGVVELGDPTEVRVTYTPVKEGTIIGPLEDEGDNLVEAAATPSGKKWGVLIIQEGLSRNRNNYGRKCLKEAAPLYEGARIYMDHQEEPRKFGRSTKDVAGFLKDVQVALVNTADPTNQEAEAQGLVALAATAVVTKPAVRQELLDAYQEGKPDLFGLSHDVLAESVTVMGTDGPYYDVQRIATVKSVDFVTNPAAGGRVLRLVASDTVPHTLERDGHMLKKMIEAIMASGNTGLIGKLKALGEAPTEDQVLGIYTEAFQAPAPKQEAAAAPPAAAPKQEAQPPAGAVQAGGTVTVQEAEWLEVRRDGLADFLESSLAGCSLPDAVKEHLRADFTSRINAATNTAILPAKKAITEAIGGQVTLFGKLAEQHVVVPTPGRATDARVVGDRLTKINEALESFFDPTKPAVSFRNLYAEITGDTKITGLVKEATRLTEALNTASWPQILGDSITRRMLREYQAQPQATWRGTIAEVVPVSDFRTQRRMRFGGYGNLPIVGQGAPYGALASPTDEEATYAPAKRGGTESVTLEMIANDDVGSIRRIPARLAKAAHQTLYEFVFDFMRTNAVIYDGAALAVAGHGTNISVVAITAALLSTARLTMKQQLDLNSGKRLGINARYLFVPTDLEELAFHLCTSDKALGPNATIPTTPVPTAANFLKKLGIEPITVDYWTDASDCWVTGSVGDQPMIEIGFWGGREEPELFVQDTPNVGSLFSNDQITYKIRHVYGGAVLDFRPFFGFIVP